MLQLLYPDDYVYSIRDIDYVKLYALGYRGLIFDIDNTLVKNNAPADPGIRAFFKRLCSYGFKIVLLSNNKEPRVKKFAEAVQADGYFYKAGKPSVKGYYKAMELMGTKTHNTLFIGDQLFTDIIGGNRADIHTVMVRPIKKWHEEIQIILKRILEDAVMLFYKAYVKHAKEEWQVPLMMDGKRIVDI